MYICVCMVSRSVLSDSLWPHGLQPTSLFCPCDSPEEYWSGLPCPSWGDVPKPGIKPGLPELHADSLPSESPGKPHMSLCVCVYMCVYIYMLSHVQLFTIPCTIARQAPQSMGFSRHKFWSGFPFPSPGSLAPCSADRFYTTESPGNFLPSRSV